MHSIITWFLYYSLIFLIISFILYIDQKKFYKKNKIYLKSNNIKFNWRIYIILIFIFLIHAFRDIHLGSDYSNYVNLYKYTMSTGKLPIFLKVKEIGYAFLHKTFANYLIPYQIFFGTISLFIWYFFIKSSYKFTFLLPIMFYFAITDGFFLWSQSGLRQSIAIVIFFYSIKYIIEKKFLYYIFYILLGFLFHKSILFTIPFYFINKFKFNRIPILILLLISISGIGNILISSIMVYLFDILFKSFNVFSHYIQYANIDRLISSVHYEGTGVATLIRILSTFFILYQSKKVIKIQPSLTIYYNLFFIYVIIENIFIGNEIILRFLLYFKIIFTIVMASTIYYSRRKYEKLISILIIFAFFIIYLSQVYHLYNDYYSHITSYNEEVTKSSFIK